MARFLHIIAAPFVRSWRFVIMQLEAAATVLGHLLKASDTISVEPLPTLSIHVVSPTGQVFAGDQVVVSLSDSVGQPVTDATLTVDGAAVAASPDGTYTFVAVVDAPAA